MIRRLLHFIALTGLLTCATPTLGWQTPASRQKPWQLAGKVSHVVDGDTFVLRDRGATPALRTIRFGAIDTPEFSQAHASAATRRLAALIEGKSVRASCYKHDPRGRDVCRVFLGGRDVALDMVAGGLAWHFVRFEKEQTEAERESYRAAELEAKRARRGLWADNTPMPPWDCRDALRALRKCR
jgi:endonuclease YncB( thermonuclease family)